MPTTPTWAAPQNGVPGDLNSTNAAAHVNQHLGVHASNIVYDGTQTLTPNGGNTFFWATDTVTRDIAQPFTLSGTTVSRIIVPVLPFGNGADLLVSLYPDNAGVPNTSAPAIASTMLPAAVSNQLAAVNGLGSGGPLATAQSNSLTPYFGTTVDLPWAGPTGDGTGTGAQNAAMTVSGSYFVSAGGFTTVPVAGVSTTQYLGGNQLLQSIPQPALPVASFYGSLAATTDSLLYMGGTSATAALATVWVASWDPNTGVVGTWSAQTPLPTVRSTGASAVSGSTVYYIGGSDNGGTPQNTVYYASVINGQVGAWASATPLPVALTASFAAVLNGWLIVAGGFNPANVHLTGTYYSRIRSDGSLGPWQTGPNLNNGVSSYAPGWDQAVTDSALLICGGFTTGGGNGVLTQILTVTADGPAPLWYCPILFEAGLHQVGLFTNGDGTWDLVNPRIPNSDFRVVRINPMPWISIPINATGLTNGAVYHVLFQQRTSGNATDRVGVGITGNALPFSGLHSFRYSGVWTSFGLQVPMAVFDNSAPSFGHSAPRHVNSDNSLVTGPTPSWSTLLHNNEGLLSGVTETTMTPNPPLNVNPTFTSGVSPWVATNGTITQSAVQTQGGFPFSGLLTPTGGFSQSFASSEFISATQSSFGSAQWYFVNGWFFSPTGTANFSLSVNWFDSSKSYLSTSSNTVSLVANTWTQVNNYFNPPAATAYASLVPTEGGTPGPTNLIYLSNVTFTPTPETTPSLASVAQVTYGPNGYPATGINQLA